MSAAYVEQDPPKKPRHRHSPHQLVALNEVYEHTEHPSLEVREELARKLGMKIKTVNSWYQNKRASSKKRHRGGVASSALDPFYKTGTLEDEQDEYDGSVHSVNQRQSQDYDRIPNEYRGGPSQHLTDDQWGPYVTSDAARSHFEMEEARSQSDNNSYATVPPASRHPSLSSAGQIGIAPPTGHTQHANSTYPRHDISSSTVRGTSPIRHRLVSARRETTPYATHQQPSVPRGSSRTRPNSYQLIALKENYARNPTPSLEERAVIATELGMEVLKVTNWYRNARQTNRNRVKREYYEDSGSASPRGTSSNRSSSMPPAHNLAVDSKSFNHQPHGHSSEEEMQEAVTPTSTPSPLIMSPSPHENKQGRTRKSSQLAGTQAFSTDNKENGGPTLDEAHLLLGFYRHQI